MPYRIQYKKIRGRHFIKQWRKHRGLTQEQLAERLETTKPAISRIETFKQPYTQDFLEACAIALQTDAASLIMRNPTDSEGLWSIWDQAKPGQRLQIIEVAKTLMKTGT